MHLKLLLRLSIITLVLIPSYINAQITDTISGEILDSKGNPLEFVNVGIAGLARGSVTNDQGIFNIANIPSGNHTLIASMIGFETTKHSIEIQKGQPIPFIKITLKESNQSLDEVVISGTMKEVSKLQSPVPVEVYSAEFFKANPAPSVFEALQNVNGVRPQVNCNICNTGDIHINGLEGPYTMVLLDGMPIVSGLSTVYGLTGIPQSLIERMEVVKGPASTLYGSEAVGGLINIITKKPVNAPLVSTDVMASSWGEINSDIGVRYQMSKKSQSILGINYFNYQNPIDKNNDGFTDVTLQNRISIFNKVSFDRKDNKELAIAARYVYEDRWGGEMNWEKVHRGGTEVYGESIYTSRWEMFGTYQLPTSEHFKFQFSANGHNQNSVYGDTRYLADQYIGFGQMVWNKPLLIHDILVGLAYRFTYYDDNTPATTDSSGANDVAITHLPGVFIQDEITLSETNKLLLGLRYDHNSIHGSIFSPRINYKWNSLDQKNIIRLSVGNGYRVANVFTEDHAALTGAREVVFEEKLKPETSWNGNLNLVKKIYTSTNLYIGLDASAFYTHFSNAILPDYETNPNQIIYGNLDGHAVSKGTSLNVDFSWANGLSIVAGGTLMDVSVTEGDHTFRQLLTERFSGVWNIGYTFQNVGISVDYTGNVYGPMRLPLLGELDDRPAYSDWYSLQNIQLTKSLKRWEFYAGIKNLLNFTPPANSIARSFDPFDEGVTFDSSGQVVSTPSNPNALTFDPAYVYAPNQGIRGFFGLRYTL